MIGLSLLLIYGYGIGGTKNLANYLTCYEHKCEIIQFVHFIIRIRLTNFNRLSGVVKFTKRIDNQGMGWYVLPKVLRKPTRRKSPFKIVV